MSEERSIIPWNRRIRTRLTISVLLGIILPLVLFFVISSEITNDKLRVQIENDLHFASYNASVAFEGLIQQVATGLRVDLHAKGLEDKDERERIMAVSSILRRTESVADLSYIGIDGAEIVRLSQTRIYFDDDLRDFSGHPSLEAVRRGQTYIGPPYLTPHGTMIDIGAPYVDTEGRLVGMMLAGVTIRRLYEEYLAHSVAVRTVYIVDSDGIIIAHPDFRLVLNRTYVADTPIVEATSPLEPGESTDMMRYSNTRLIDVFGVGTCNPLGWVFISEMREEEAMTGIYQTRRGFAAIFVVASLVGLLASLYIGGKAAKAIVNMEKTTRRFGEGDFSERVGVSGSDELSALAGAINVMAEKLHEYYKHLEGDVDLLNRKVAERTESLQKAYDDLKKSAQELRVTQTALVQTEKLASLGMLVAGVVHEVNNPLSFIINNISILKRDTQALASVVEKFQQTAAETDPQRKNQLLKDAQRNAEEVNLQETLEAIDRMLERTDEGLAKIKKIVGDLRDFSHMGETEKAPSDLNANMESVIGMVSYELKKKQIRLDKDFADLPPVVCAAMKINQVVLNIMLNAIQAVGEDGHIWIKTWREKNMIGFSIRDDGPGIPPELLVKIFDPFFTTRPPGEGTGLGLSISYGIIKEHHGTIFASSVPGEGAEFIVRIPIDPQEQAEPEA